MAMDVNDSHIDLETFKKDRSQRFCHHINKIFFTWNLDHLYDALLNLLPSKIIVYLDMFGLFMEHRVVCHTKG